MPVALCGRRLCRRADPDREAPVPVEAVRAGFGGRGHMELGHGVPLPPRLYRAGRGGLDRRNWRHAGRQMDQGRLHGCYDEQIDSPCASRCSCPAGHTGGVPSGFPEIRWYYHEHDPLEGGNPHIKRQDTCACTACVAPPPSGGCTGTWVDTDGDGVSDGISCNGGEFIPVDPGGPDGPSGQSGPGDPGSTGNAGGVGAPGTSGSVGGGSIGGMGGVDGGVTGDTLRGRAIRAIAATATPAVAPAPLAASHDDVGGGCCGGQQYGEPQERIENEKVDSGCCGKPAAGVLRRAGRSSQAGQRIQELPAL